MTIAHTIAPQSSMRVKVSSLSFIVVSFRVI
jgi:hypothetical protein